MIWASHTRARAQKGGRGRLHKTQPSALSWKYHLANPPHVSGTPPSSHRAPHAARTQCGDTSADICTHSHTPPANQKTGDTVWDSLSAKLVSAGSAAWTTSPTWWTDKACKAPSAAQTSTAHCPLQTACVLMPFGAEAQATPISKQHAFASRRDCAPLLFEHAFISLIWRHDTAGSGMRRMT